MKPGNAGMLDTAVDPALFRSNDDVCKTESAERLPLRYGFFKKMPAAFRREAGMIQALSLMQGICNADFNV